MNDEALRRYFEALNAGATPQANEVDDKGRPTDAFWTRKLAELEAPFKYRFNDIQVRMKFRAELRRLEALAEEMDEATTFKVALSMRMARQR